MARGVISAVICLALLELGFAQFAKRPTKSKGPRALAVMELAANGKAHLIPVTIMIDGRFYDASAYKADPVPMALDGGTVYEALKTGVPQGLFIVGGAMSDDKKGWVADGKWRSTAQIEADKAKAKAEADKKAQKAPPPEQQIGAPPRLRRGPEPVPETAPEKSPKASSAPPAPAPAPGPASPSDAAEDPNRPVLRRVAPSETSQEQTKGGGGSAVITKRPTQAGIAVESLSGPIELIPAISDASGPEARPYSFEMKPDAERGFLKKMLAMAGEEVKARAAKRSAESGGSAAKEPDLKGQKPRGPKSRASYTTGRPTPAPQFQDVQMHVYDLSNSNEPVLVLTAKATWPSAPEVLYMIALVSREDIYGDLHKVFAQTTDNQHLDALAKYDLIDAVDADGDGGGELLFRMTSEAGSAFGIYRVIGDKLWPLFEGKPR
jgi:hypothetical protein